MQIKRAIVSLALLCAITSSVPVLGAEGWTTNWEEAKKTAAKEKKDILIDFTGSDWCGWCIKLKDEVFTKDEFKKEAPKHFVLLELDFPRRKQLAPDLKKQNEALRDQFQIRGYPTILLVDAKGRPFARTGYQPGGPANYISHLKEKLETKAARDASFAKADKEKDPVKRAQLLDTALSQLERQGVLMGYEDVMSQIIELDKDNNAKLRAKYDEFIQMGKIQSLIGAGKLDDAIKAVEDYSKSELANNESKQKAVYFKAQALYMKKDFDSMLKALEEAQKLAPDTQIGKQIPALIKRLKAQKDGE